MEKVNVNNIVYDPHMSDNYRMATNYSLGSACLYIFDRYQDGLKFIVRPGTICKDPKTKKRRLFISEDHSNRWHVNPKEGEIKGNMLWLEKEDDSKAIDIFIEDCKKDYQSYLTKLNHINEKLDYLNALKED